MRNKFNLYIYLVSLLSIIITGCEDDVIYNNLKVNDIDLIDADKDQCISIAKGSSYTTRVKMLPVASTDKADYHFLFSSSNDNIFTVDTKGVIKGIAIGEATLTVYAANNKNIIKTCTIRVLPNLVTSIEIPVAYQNYKMLVGETLNLKEVITVLPLTADDLTVTFSSSDTGIATISDNGILTSKAIGDIDVIIRAADGGGAAATCSIHISDELTGDFPRTEWSITTSHDYTPDTNKAGKVTGSPEDMLDGNSQDTYFSLKKPGKGNVPSGASIFFTIDMNTANPFNYFRWCHRMDNSTIGLRVAKVDVYGSNHGEIFTEIKKEVKLDVNIPQVTVNFGQDYTYRYLKFIITDYGTTGSAVQISEIYIGKE